MRKEIMAFNSLTDAEAERLALLDPEAARSNFIAGFYDRAA